ncbi:MAG: hypothetical protein ACHREM_07935 [Polyangiales bacterium]
MKRLLFTFAASAVLTASTSANAQSWLQAGAATQGTGIKTGDVEFHPGVGVELGYDSNYFQRSGIAGDPAGPVVDTVRLRVSPSLNVSTLAAKGPQSVKFVGGVAIAYSEFLSNTGPSSDQTTLGRNREVGVTGNAALSILPGHPFSVNIADFFARTTQPSYSNDVTQGLDRDDNRISLEGIYTKAGGLLDWRVGAAVGFTLFENVSAAPLSNYRYEGYTRGKWRFLPRTALVYEYTVTAITYDSAAGSTVSRPNGYPMKVRVGLNGLLTDRLTVNALVGWGATFYQGGGDFDSFIGQLEGRYFLGEGPNSGNSVALGVSRDFTTSFIGNYATSNRVYGSATTLIAQRFFLSASAGISYTQYPDVYDVLNPTVKVNNAFTAVNADVSIFGEYRVRDWLAFNATFLYAGQLKDETVTYNVSTTGTATPFNFKYNRFQALVGVRVYL